MDLHLASEQEQLVESFATLLRRHSTPERVRECEPEGFDAVLWSQLQETGAIEMAVPELDGGWGASLLDLALVAEQLGRALASAPVIEAQVAARLLSSIESDDARSLLSRALSGEQLVTIAVRPAVNGVATLVPAAAVADVVVALDGDRLVAASSAGWEPIENLGSMALADVPLEGSADLAVGPLATAGYQAAIDEWMTLTGSALVGIGARALEIVVKYAKERKAFGVPIGSFQAISHRLADSAAALDGALLLSRKAAWVHEAEPGHLLSLQQ